MNLFLNACGMRRPLQVEVEHRLSHRIEIRTLDQPFAVIGRDPNCDIVLGDKQVSRRHAYLQVIAGRLFWVDLDSQLGTFVEGQTWKSGWLGGGRLIAVGPNIIRQFAASHDQSLKETDEATMPQGSPLSWRTWGTEELVEATVEFVNGPSESKSWPIRRVVSLLGTARRCKFRLADRSIEPFQCSLIRTSQGLFVVDLLGGEGVKVNDIPTRTARLNHGDMLEIGRYQIRVHYRDREALADQQSPQPNDRGLAPNATQANLPAPFFPAPGLSSNPKAELLPYDGGVNYPATANRNDLTESVLVPLVSQFGMMQQQMFDQFQQTMSMMVQMFGKMHESQMELIRQEFGRLNDLTTEMNGLKAELAEMSRRQAETTTPPQPQANVSTARLQPTATLPPQKSKSPSPNPSAAKPTKEAMTPGPKSMEAEAGVSTNPAAPSVNPRQQPQPPPGDEAPAPGATAQSDRDAIVWLHQRITSIQNEHEGRWQKILKLLPGSS